MYANNAMLIFKASLASWATVLRIMGDLPDSDTVGDHIEVAGVGPHHN